MSVRRPLLALCLCCAVACDGFDLGVVPGEGEPDAGVAPVRPDPGGPEPGPIERCADVDASIAYAEADAHYPAYSGSASQLTGNWIATPAPITRPDSMTIAFAPTGTVESKWIWRFSAKPLGEVLRTITYPGAKADPDPGEKVPSFEVISETRTCDQASGSFRVHRLEFDASGVKTFAASFEQRCGTGTAALRGCVQFLAGK